MPPEDAGKARASPHDGRSQESHSDECDGSRRGECGAATSSGLVEAQIEYAAWLDRLMVMRVASSLPFQATVEHRAAAAMQGVTLELAKRDNALALQPVQFDRHFERNSGRLLSIIASPQPSQTASNGSRSPNCGHPAVFAPPTLYELLAASSSNPPTDTTSPFVDGRSRLPCSRNIAASLDKPKPPKLDSRATPLPTSASHAPQQAGSGIGKPIKSRVLGPQRIVILLRCAGCDRVL